MNLLKRKSKIFQSTFEENKKSNASLAADLKKGLLNNIRNKIAVVPKLWLV